MRGTVLSLCDRTGNFVRPWVEAGYRAVTVDLQDAPDVQPGRTHIVADVSRFPGLTGVCFVAAWVPCTDMAVSGARWFKDKGMRSLISALEIVEAARVLCEASGAPYLIENPVSTLATYWRKPDHIFDPFQFAGYAPDPDREAYTKRTCFWTGGGFVMPAPKPVDPILGSKMHLLPPSDDRANLRSETPLGVSYAVFEANAPHLRQGAAA